MASYEDLSPTILIDTTMCYPNGVDATSTLYSELHRVLKPGGRLLTISLHKEQEVLTFGCGNPTCCFVSSSCTLESDREAGLFHSLCIFDKLKGFHDDSIAMLVSGHPILFGNSVLRDDHISTEMFKYKPKTEDDLFL